MGMVTDEDRIEKHYGLLKEAMDLLFEKSRAGYDRIEEEDFWEDSLEMDELLDQVQSLLQERGDSDSVSFFGEDDGTLKSREFDHRILQELVSFASHLNIFHVFSMPTPPMPESCQ